MKQNEHVPENKNYLTIYIICFVIYLNILESSWENESDLIG